MNKDTAKQIKIINTRLEALIVKWNRDFDKNMQELLQLSTLLINLENNSTETNKALLRK
jgi:hypothetical protein